MDEFYLPPHVHCCRRGDAFVFLDLRQDDYTLVAAEAAEALRELMSGNALDAKQVESLRASWSMEDCSPPMFARAESSLPHAATSHFSICSMQIRPRKTR